MIKDNLKRIVILIISLTVMTSCAVTHDNQPCLFSVYQDRIEISYKITNERIIIPIHDGETVHQAYKRYMRNERRNKRK